MKNFATAALIAAGLALAPAAHAAAEFSFQYSYDKQQLKTEAGAREMLDDLKAEITEHCDHRFTGSRLTNSILDRRCTDRTLEKTVIEINSPTLSKVYEEMKAAR